jgi:hypothetical protein
MDVSDASYYILKEIGNKGSQMGHTKNKNKLLPLYLNHGWTLDFYIVRYCDVFLKNTIGSQRDTNWAYFQLFYHINQMITISE